MEKIIMKSFLYTIAFLLGVTTIAQAEEQKADESVIVEEVSAENPDSEATKETK